MKKLTITIFALLMAVGMAGCSKVEAVDVKLETAQCDMCANKIETALKATEGVKSVSVNLEQKMAHVTYSAAATSIALIEKAITDAGYAANDKAADPAAYDKLSECCKM